MNLVNKFAIAAIVISLISTGITLAVYSNLHSDREAILGVLKEQSGQIDSLNSKINSTQQTMENLKSDATQIKIQMSKADSDLGIQRGDMAALNQTLHNLHITTTEYSAGTTVTLSPGQQGLSKARCNPGEIVTGGGYDTSDASIIVLHNGIATEQGWDVIAKNTGTLDQGYYAFAVCSKIIP